MPVGDIDILEEPLPLPTRSAPWPLLTRLPTLLAEANGSPSVYRDFLRQAHEELKARFLAEEPIEDLVHARAAVIDVVLREAWRTQQLANVESWTLVAVGGYGRGELHPCSDIDIMLWCRNRRIWKAAATSSGWLLFCGISASKWAIASALLKSVCRRALRMLA